MMCGCAVPILLRPKSTGTTLINHHKSKWILFPTIHPYSSIFPHREKPPENWIPSGKLSHNYGKPPFSLGKSTINSHVPL
jgi:hypothetical protein